MNQRPSERSERGPSIPAGTGGTGRADPPRITNLRELKDLGYRARTVKEELRDNTLARLRAGLPLFPGIVGYDETVVPQVVAGILSQHDLLLLGLRGQAKTRILRAMVGLLDEWMPVIGPPPAGTDLPVAELRDDPLGPRTGAGRRIVEALGDRTPVSWVHRSDRYLEKLATPDVTIADLIGEIDLVKYAAGAGGGAGALGMADERTMHFGLVPRASRGLFVINELPDLSPRIQVGLFNVLEERDIQIRGYPVRMDLDVCLMFSANPEDYTNRGRIVTPLKDRIGTVVRTHYPADNKEAMRITLENAFVERGSGSGARGPGVVRGLGGEGHAGERAQPVERAPGAAMPSAQVVLPPVIHEIIEETIRLARRSPHINQASGVSVRASITAVEDAVSSAEARAARTGEPRVAVRPCDLAMVVPALRGKIELMLAEDGGSDKDGRSTEDRLIEALVGEGVKAVLGRKMSVESFAPVADAFKGGLRLELGDTVSAADALASMKLVPGLVDASAAAGKALGLDAKDEQLRACCGELVLEFLYVNNRISKRGWTYLR